MDEHLKRVVAHHDWWSEGYDSEYFERFALYHGVTLDNIRRFLPRERGALILDAGGGTGIWSIELAKMGYHVVLTDISRGMLKKAEEKVRELTLKDRVEMMVSDICDMPEFTDDHFDLVLCEGDALSYCGNHDNAVKEFARVVKPGGVVIASVDNRASVLSWLKDKGRDAVQRLLETGEVVMPLNREEFRYAIHAFTPEELKDLFKSKGLSAERIIGKLVIAHRLPWFNSEDPAVQEWLYRLELKYNGDPGFYPWAGHLEIVGRKNKHGGV